MFENYFKDEVERVSNDKSLLEKLWAEIKFSYGSSKRHYHNLYHLDSVIKELSIVREQINDWHTLVFSVAYHDIIYDAVKKDNEERSASLSYTRLTQLGLPELQKEKCRLQILATKNHNINVEEDTNYFTDADLSILGADPSDYLKYCEQIRKEYKLFPDFLYKPGRKKVLSHFLEMKSIFKTKFFQDKFEANARTNIANELALLS